MMKTAACRRSISTPSSSGSSSRSKNILVQDGSSSDSSLGNIFDFSGWMSEKRLIKGNRGALGSSRFDLEREAVKFKLICGQITKPIVIKV